MIPVKRKKGKLLARPIKGEMGKEENQITNFRSDNVNITQDLTDLESAEFFLVINGQFINIFILLTHIHKQTIE